MSRNNGDRARYNRKRNEKIHKKAGSRELRELLQKTSRVPDPTETAGKAPE
jgi:hypothetical protein